MFYKNLKTVRRWQRSVLLVKGGHCVGDNSSKEIQTNSMLTSESVE